MQSAARVVAPDEDEVVDIPIRERAEDHSIYDAEHRGVRADAECQRERRDRRETRISTQSAHGVTHVLRERLDTRLPAAGAHALLRRLDAAHFQSHDSLGGVTRQARPHLFLRGSLEVVA